MILNLGVWHLQIILTVIYLSDDFPIIAETHQNRNLVIHILRHMGQLALSCLQYAAQFLSQHAGTPWGDLGVFIGESVYFMEIPKVK